MTGERDERLQRALGYPYDWPGACYLFRGGEAAAVDDRAARRAGRIPVVAYGSNRSPEQLRRKFGALGDAEAILVEAGRVAGFDVVHAARITTYGALPAAMIRAPGVTVTVAITWLDAEQLVRMDASEHVGVNYGRAPVSGTVRLADGTGIGHAEFYDTTHPALDVDGVVASHADTPAEGRARPAYRNAELLRRLHAAHARGVGFDAFVLRLVDEPDYRIEVATRLRRGL